MSDQTTVVDEPSTGLDAVVQTTEAKILHLLTVFPALSATMIQTGIGTSTSPQLWRPILENLVKEGKVMQLQVPSYTPHSRHQVYNVYHLSAFDYTEARKPLLPEPEPQSDNEPT